MKHHKYISIIKTGILYFCLLLLFTFTFNSCYTTHDTALLQDSKSLPVYEKTNFTDYKIQPNDELLFRVLSSDEDFVNLIGMGGNSGSSNKAISYRVYPDSIVDLPFVDTIKVAGFTLDEAEEKIKNKFREIIPDAEVKLTLANKTYTVIGDIGTGVFPAYREKLTIYQALAQAGEILLSGDRKHIRIIRETSSKPEILEFDIRPKSVIDSKYYYVYPNDIIYVQRNVSSFYKVNNYSSFLGLITSSISLFITVFYLNKTN
ncbi:Polysaccharide export protein, BexD/CtrA/VexA family protein [uncultured Paludibacter sp.]|uniref:Polysaccharide export protein, BexD/CtrA/VexA family protein n=1 Tax=uncultured Paludibacter sp. TaxID=497635 RepID=A0A653AC88_9BACT|nr:Polysaccharide export protein, BexD/CtrA/VexA family protein [uncultured Paludibacter sp.]